MLIRPVMLDSPTMVMTCGVIMMPILLWMAAIYLAIMIPALVVISLMFSVFLTHPMISIMVPLCRLLS